MKIRYVLLTLLLTFTSTVTFAGFTQPQKVQVNLEQRTALGDMFTARFEKDDAVFIGCGIRASSTGEDTANYFGFCQALDSEGDQISCFTNNRELLDTMKATSDFSFVTFSWDENDSCTRIGFSTQSFYIPNFVLQKEKFDYFQKKSKRAKDKVVK